MNIIFDSSYLNNLILNVLNYFIHQFMGCVSSSLPDPNSRQAIYQINEIQKAGELTQKNKPIINAEEKGIEQIQCKGEKLYKLKHFEMKQYPYCSIGAITARDKSGHLVKGSGALISNYFVITAAHVVFNRKQGPLYKSSTSEEDQKYGASYKNIRFYPAAYDILQEQKGIEVECWRYPLQYPDFKCENYQAFDYAILKLKESVPQPVGGFLSPKAYSHETILKENSSKELQIFGYPYKQNLTNYEPDNKDDKAFTIFQYGLKKLQRIKEIDKQNGIIYYQISTAQGQSGCPLVFGEDYIGIHARGYDSLKLNGGTLFTQQIIKMIKKWEKQIIDIILKNLQLKGKQSLKKKKFEKALADYTTAIQIDPKYTDAYFNRGLTYFNLKDYHKALADYTTAIQIDPKYTNAYNNRGITQGDLEDYSKAMAVYIKAIQIDPKYATDFNNRGNTYKNLKNYPQALADYTTAIQIDPKYAIAYRNRGITYKKLKDYHKALADYTTAIQIDPKYANAYYNRGLTYYELKDYDKALADYTTVIQIDPKYTDAYNDRGNTQDDLKDYDKALADYTTAIQIDPKYAYAYNNRGFTYADLKDYDKALADYTTAIQIDPKFSMAYINRGITYCDLKDYTNALSDFQSALSLSPHDPFYLIHISICWDLLGEAYLSAKSSAKCEQSLSSKDPAQIQADFGLSESNMDFIRSNLSRLKAKLTLLLI